jgi:hypothetical protein
VLSSNRTRKARFRSQHFRAFPLRYDLIFAIKQSPPRPLRAFTGPALNAEIDGVSAAFIDVAMKSARFIVWQRGVSSRTMPVRLIA